MGSDRATIRCQRHVLPSVLNLCHAALTFCSSLQGRSLGQSCLSLHFGVPMPVWVSIIYTAACMQAKKGAKQKKKAVQLDSDADDMSMDDDSEDSDFEGAPKKVRLCGLCRRSVHITQ